jgi:hypothetical protein
MNRQEDEKLWDLLGHSREPAASPFFARNVLRKIREAQGETTPRRWFSLRWLAPAAGVAVAIMATLLLRVQVPKAVGPEMQGDKIVLSEADGELLADVDDLLVDDDGSLEDDGVLL